MEAASNDLALRTLSLFLLHHMVLRFQAVTSQHTMHHFKFNQYGTDPYLGVFLVVFHY